MKTLVQIIGYFVQLSPAQTLDIFDEFLFDEETRRFQWMTPTITDFLDWIVWQGQFLHCLARIQEYPR